MPALDALRGIAAGWVVVHHAAMLGLIASSPLVANGWLGVDVFFALSGYLMWRQHVKRPALSAWYMARARRLLPMHLVVLAAVALPLWLAGTLDADPRLLLLAPNAAMTPKTPLAVQVLWSLGVEYHAYLLLPLLLRSRWAAPALGALILLGPLARWGAADGHAAYVSTMGRIDGLAWGALAGMWQNRGLRVPLVLGVLVALVLLTVVTLVGIHPHEQRWSVAGFSCASAAAALLVVCASAMSWAPAPLMSLGRMSYSLYLLHVPTMAGLSVLGVPGWLAMAATVPVTCAIWRWVEVPLSVARPVVPGTPSTPARNTCASSPIFGTSAH